jgi:lactoylglutathione lyase
VGAGPGRCSRRAHPGRQLTRLTFISLYVRDVPAELGFYERAFGFERRHLDTKENGAYGELATGATIVAFASHELVGRHLPIAFRAHEPAKRPAAFELTIELDDLDAGIQRAVECGASIVAPPELKAWGQRLAFIRDPEGLLVGLTDRPAA